MRKSVILLALLLLLVFPAIASAQSPVSFEQLDIQFWPDYDQPSVLVMYDFVVSADTLLPTVISVRIPAGSQLFAVAREESGGLMNVQYDQPVQVGNYSVVSFSVTDRSTHRVEFYVPYVLQEQRRTFIYIWPGDYDVATFKFWLQEPIGATNVMTEPAMSNLGPSQNGFTYQSLVLQNVKVGENLSLKFSYDKDNASLAGGVQPSAPLEQSQPLMSFLPWILGGVGVALIVGGGVWYWVSGRASSGAGRSRKRHTAQAEEEPVAMAYCSQCGKRAGPGDRFCRACGTKLRQ